MISKITNEPMFCIYVTKSITGTSVYTAHRIDLAPRNLEKVSVFLAFHHMYEAQDWLYNNISSKEDCVDEETYYE